jgi:uncharacterized YigZ family protein
MVEPYPVPAANVRSELIVLNSRFIASAAPAFTVEQARSFMDQIRSEFPDATHNVPAFLIGFGPATIAHCSDAGEPAGTAGKPILAVLRGSGLGDIVVVVTRYFGGTKLGTGGLVRAYSQSVQNVLSIMPRAVKRAAHLIMLNIPYPYFERIRLLAARHQGFIIDETFAGEVTLSIRFPVEAYEPFRQALAELSSGSLEPVIVETNPETIFPLDPPHRP